MVKEAPVNPYIYQHFGELLHPDYAEEGRLYGVGHPNPMVTVHGLTKYEAEAVCEVLRSMQGAPEAA